ncbi:MAG TPA: dNTP triphosphohydrolase, partial [Longimicrobium sp.]|nr:dNTP triphosphohydrolase [Longimicrobium sp.]
IARRLAEKLGGEQVRAADALGGVDPSVAEAAALAHDLGHPPFGHIAEEELDSLARAHNAPEGFEGNAQTFRILTRLATHRSEYAGLDLTRATLNGVLKYPWLRDTRQKGADPKKAKKFGAYSSEIDDFNFAREGYGSSDRQSPEAAIMDHADAIAYSVHDLDDFYRAGLIPLESLVSSDEEWLWFANRWKAVGAKVPEETIDTSREEFRDLITRVTAGAHYSGTRKERAVLRGATSSLIDQFVRGVRLREPDEGGDGALVIQDSWNDLAVRFLQALVWVYVIKNPRLATQQYGQRQIVRFLFSTYLSAVMRRELDFVPALFRSEVEELGGSNCSGDRQPIEQETRIAIDIVAHFTDSQAVLLYRRLTGAAPGSVVEMLHG